jgi:hypothetical protein
VVLIIEFCLVVSVTIVCLKFYLVFLSEVYILILSEIKTYSVNLTLSSVGYFLRTESVGGGHIYPPNVFLIFFSGAPLKFKIFAICFIGLMGS